MPVIEEHGPNRGNIPVGRGWDVMSRHLQDGTVLARVGAKGTHSSPALSLQELRLQGELRGNVSQLRALFLRSRCLDKQRVWGVHHAWQRISPVHTEQHLMPIGLKWSHKKSRACLGSGGQISIGHAAIHIPYTT